MKQGHEGKGCLYRRRAEARPAAPRCPPQHHPEMPTPPVGTSLASEEELEASAAGDPPPRPASASQGLGQAPPQLRALWPQLASVI